MVSGEAARTCVPGKPHTWAEHITETHCRNMQESFTQEYLDGRVNAVWASGGATTTQASVSLLLAPRILSCVFRGVGTGRRGRRFIASWRGTIVCGYCSLLHGDLIDPGGYCCLLVGFRSSFLEGMLYPDGIMRSISSNGYHIDDPKDHPYPKQ